MVAGRRVRYQEALQVAADNRVLGEEPRQKRREEEGTLQDCRQDCRAPVVDWVKLQVVEGRNSCTDNKAPKLALELQGEGLACMELGRMVPHKIHCPCHHHDLDK